ncbi:MAG: hypothetical protein J5J00_02490 [Deltaproteobacteria bacterium]|nr:hypothetical protein [Deltaproteobacteria bacterium]
MDNETFRSRVVNLLNRSRKALRLYSSVGRSGSRFTGERFASEGGVDLSESHTKEWRNITSELLKDLSSAIERGASQKQLVSDMYFLRDKYNSHWRSLESEMHFKQRELIGSAENGDFVRAALVANDLVLMKARMQAAQAAHHELQEVITRSKVTQPTIELAPDDMLSAADEQPAMGKDRAIEIPIAKVIPLRKLL